MIKVFHLSLMSTLLFKVPQATGDQKRSFCIIFTVQTQGQFPIVHSVKLPEPNTTLVVNDKIPTLKISEVPNVLYILDPSFCLQAVQSWEKINDRIVPFLKEVENQPAPLQFCMFLQTHRLRLDLVGIQAAGDPRGLS